MRSPFDQLNDSLPQRVSHGLSKIGLAMRHQAWTNGSLHGLPPTQAQILALLNIRGPTRVTTIAHEMAVKIPTATDAINSLCTKGLASKKKDKEDKRVNTISLTKAGHKQAQTIVDWPDLLQQTIEELNTEEQRVLFVLLNKTILSLQKKNLIPIQHMCVCCKYFRPHQYDDQDTPHHCAYVDAPFGNQHLRLDCPEQQPAEDISNEINWLKDVKK